MGTAIWSLGLLRIMAYNVVQLLRKRRLRLKDDQGNWKPPRPWRSTFNLVFRALTATIAAELGDASGGHYHSLFVIGIVLMCMALAVNLTADLVVKGIRGKQNA